MDTALAQVRALRIHSGSVDLHCTNGHSKRAPFTPFTPIWIRMEEKQVLMMTSWHVDSTTLERGSSGATCLGRCEARGRTTLGRAGGAKIHPITRLSSCLPITRAVPWR